MAFVAGNHDFYGKPNNTPVSLENSFFEAFNFGYDNEPNPGILYTSSQTRSWNRSIMALADPVDAAQASGTMDFPFTGPIGAPGPFTVASSFFWSKRPSFSGDTYFWHAYFGPEGGDRAEDTVRALSLERAISDQGRFVILPDSVTPVVLTFTFDEGWWTNLSVTYEADGDLTVQIERDDGVMLLDHTGNYDLGEAFSHFSWQMYSVGSTADSWAYRTWLDDISYIIGALPTDIPDWPVSSSFEEGVPGEFVSVDTSIVGGLHFDEGNENPPWEAIYTGVDAHSGSVAITAIEGSYEWLHFPFGTDPIIEVDEHFYFWCKFEAGYNGFFWDSCSPHQLYLGEVGAPRDSGGNYYPGRCFVEAIDATTHRWWVEWEDAEYTEDGNATQYNFDVPAVAGVGGWMKIAVDITAAGDFSYTLTEEGGTVHGPFASPIPQWMSLLPGNQQFAWHFVTVNDAIGTGYGRLLLDDVNTDGGSVDPPDPPEYQIEGPLRPHYLRTIREDDGTVIPGVLVRVCEPNTTTLISETIFTGNEGVGSRGPVWISEDGVIDFYLDDPRSVDLLLSLPDETERVWADQWIGDAENTSTEGGQMQGGITNFRVLPLATYNALSPKDPSVLYLTPEPLAGGGGTATGTPSSGFEGEDEGTPVEFSNSIFDGVEEFNEADLSGEVWGPSAFARVEFTGDESHSGSMSIRGAGTVGYPNRQIRYDDGVVTTANETMTFWHLHTLGTDGEASSGYFYSMRGGPIGTLRKDFWSDAFDIEYTGSGTYSVSFRKNTGGWEVYEVLDVPAGWVEFEVGYDHPSRTYSCKIRDAAGVEHFSQTGYLNDLAYGGTPGNYGFAHHNFLFNGSIATADGQIYLDDINFVGADPDVPVEMYVEDQPVTALYVGSQQVYARQSPTIILE